MPREPKDYKVAYERLLKENLSLRTKESFEYRRAQDLSRELERLRGLDKVVDALKQIIIEVKTEKKEGMRS